MPDPFKKNRIRYEEILAHPERMTREDVAFFDAEMRRQKENEAKQALYDQYRREKAAREATEQKAATKRPGGFGSSGFGGGDDRTRFNALDYAGALGERLIFGLSEGGAATGVLAEDALRRVGTGLLRQKLGSYYNKLYEDAMEGAVDKYGVFHNLYYGKGAVADALKKAGIMGQGDPGIQRGSQISAEKVRKLAEGIDTGSEKADKALRWTAEKTGDLAYGIGNAIPMAVEAMLTGGGSLWKGVATSTDDLARMGVGVLERSGALAALQRSGSRLLRDRQYWTSFASEVGSDYMEALGDGATEGQAMAYALAAAGLNSITEVGGGIQDPTTPVWKSAIEEGQEEMEQGPTGRALKYAFYKKGSGDLWKDLVSGEDAVFNPRTMLEEGAMGAAVGGVLAGGQHLAGSAIAGAQERRAQNAAYEGVYGADSAALVEEALELDPDNKVAQAARKRLEQGKAIPGETLRRLAEMNEAAIKERTMTPAAEENAAPVKEETAPTGEERQPAADLRRETKAAETAEEAEEHLTPAEAELRQKAREFGPAGAEAFLEAMNPFQAAEPERYYGAFKAAWLYGQANSTEAEIDPETRTELLREGLTNEQIDLAYNLGRTEVRRQERAETPQQETASAREENVETASRGGESAGMTKEGAVRHGEGAAEPEGVRVRDGSQRADGAHPGGQTGAVAEVPGGDQVRQAQGRSADRGAAAVTYAREVTTTARLIGESRGATDDRLRRIVGNKSADMVEAERLLTERGIKPYLFAGGNLRMQNNGKMVAARAYINGKTAFVRGDDPGFTAAQLARHEIGHDMIRDGEIDPEEVRERLRERFTEEELDAVAEKYAELYDGTGMTPEEIWEEILCDSVADMNVFAGTEAAQGAPVAEVLTAAKAEARSQQKSTRGPPEGKKKTAPGEGGKMSRVGRDGRLRTLEERVQGDALLDAQDLIDEVRSVGGQADENGYITLYHRTSAENAEKIRESGYMMGKEDGLFFSTRENGYNDGYGDTAVKFSIPAEMLVLDDVFGDEAHLRLPMEKPGKLYVGKYLEKETSHRYTYANLAAKEDMTVAELQSVHGVPRAEIIKMGHQNAVQFSTGNRNGVPVVHVADNNADILVPNTGLKHSLDRRVDNVGAAVAKIGEILTNSVCVNEIYARDPAFVGGNIYIGAGTIGDQTLVVRMVVSRVSNELEMVDILSAVNAKKEPAVLIAPRHTTESRPFPGSKISIAELLEIVNHQFPDILSEDVLEHFNRSRRPESELGEYKKYSRTSDSLEELRTENRELESRVKELQKALRATERKLADTRENRDNWRNRATFRPETVARGIIKAYEGTISEADIHDQLKELIERAARRDGVTFEEIKEMAMPIARKVVESARAAANGEEARTWEAIKKHHRENKIRISTETLAEFRDDPDFKWDFRRQYGRPLNLSGTEGTPIDVAYAEMGERFGKAYYPDSITHPADQLRRMAEIRESLAPVMENPYSVNMAMATEHCANELVDTVMGEVARGYRATYAGRTEEQLYQVRKSAREAIARERQRSEEQVKALKEHWREQQRQQMERRSESEDRDRLLTIARRLQNRKLPAAQRSLIKQYIGELDTVSRKLTGWTLGDLTWLEHWYNEQKADPDFIPDAATEARIRRLYQVHVDDMSRADVLELTRVLLNIENEIRTRQEFIESKEKRDVREAGLALMRNLENAPGSKASGIRSAADRLIVTETLSPLRQVRRMTGYVDNDPMVIATTALADGQRAMFDYKMKATARFAAFAQDKEFTREITGRHAREITIRGIGKDGPTEVKITPAMRISLYLHSLNPQNLQHIAGGGVRVPDIALYKKGKIAEAYARGTVIKLTPSEVRAIVGQMTAKERRFADAAHEYFNTTSKDAINDVSEKLKGYSIAGVEDYFPIHTDDSFTRKDFESIKFDGSIEGMGFLKERIKSSSPIYLQDLNSVLTQAIDLHAKYVGLAIPVRNFNKLWGVTAQNVTEDGDMGASSSVQSTVRQQWGEDGRRYIEKMMRDLQNGGKEQSEWAKELAKVRSRYAGAVLTLNPSVAMKQAASYPTAAAVVGWKALAQAMGHVGKVDLDLIAAYTPLQWYRSQGFSTQELGDMAKRGVQLLPALNWVQGADLLTTRKLWKAAEFFVKDTQPGLKTGTAQEIREGKSPFYRAVAEVYNRIIEETQPNYTTMQRPQLLRSDDTLLQNLQMFKTQPFQNFNILYDAMGELAAKERVWKNTQTEESKKALQEARKKAWWAVSSQAVQLAMFAAMTLAWNAFRGKTDKYEDDEGDVTLWSILAGVGKDMIGGLFAEIPFGGDAWELGSSMVSGGKYYGIGDVTASSINDAATALINAGKVVSGLLADIKDPEAQVDFNKYRLKLDGVADAVSKMGGIPYENVLNLGKAIFRHGARALEGDYMGQYRYLQLTTDPNGSYKGDYYDLLWEAYRKDKKAHAELYRQMVEDGWDPDKIKSAIENRMKKAEGVESVKDLKERYTAP